MKRVLGLDLGTNSIGWAVLDVPEHENPEENTGTVVAMGSRIFTQGAEEAGSALETPAKVRRAKRSMRRQIQRRAKRRQRIRHELTAIGLLPDGDLEFDDLMKEDPAALMQSSTEGAVLSLREIGRVIYWFSSQRGFLSLRAGGGDTTDEDDDRATRNRYRNPQTVKETGEIKVRGQENILVDFLYQQAQHHPALLTDEIIFGARGRLTYPVRPIKQGNFLSDGDSWLGEFGIHGLVFFQRSVYWDQKTIGTCSLDPRKGGPRVLRADRNAQKYRVWKNVLDLRVETPQRSLSDGERKVVYDTLMTQGSVSFNSLRKKLKLPDDAAINLALSEREELKGNETDAAMRKTLGDAWEEMDEQTRDNIVSVLLGNALADQVRAVLMGKQFGLTHEQAEAALLVGFPSGRSMFGRHTIKQLLRFMPEGPMASSEALQETLGGVWEALSDTQQDQMISLLLDDAKRSKEKKALSATLASDFGLSSAQIKAVVGVRANESKGIKEERGALIKNERHVIQAAGFRMPEEVRSERPVEIEKLTNPLVRQTLSQLRKVLHAVAHTHGLEGDQPFDVVRIELTRDVRSNYRARKETNQRQRQNEKDNKAAEKMIEDFAPGAKISYDHRRRARLWKEQGEQCLYCGQPISSIEAFTGATELDHILPQSRTLDNSMANLALVHADENQEKGNRTLTEWLGPEDAFEIAMRAKKYIPYPHWKPKMRRIEAIDVADAPVPEALLVQTGYINSVARDFIRQELGMKAEVSSGRITASLLYHTGLKKDGEDHRRHAQDAAIVAICDRRTSLRLAKAYKKKEATGSYSGESEYGGFEPWEGFREQVKACYTDINVSHAVKGKMSGQWHEETYYGKVESPYLEGDDVYAFRRPVSWVTSPKKLAEVADPAVQEALRQNLRDRGLDPEGSSFKFDEKNPPHMPKDKNGDANVINTVRLHVNKPGNKILRPETEPKTGVVMGRNHSAFLYENTETGKWRLHIVTRFDAFLNRGLSLSETRAVHAEEDEEFLFSVTIGAALLLEMDGKDELFFVKSLAPSLQSLDMRPASTTAGNKNIWFRASKLQKFKARKVVVLPNGEVRTARD